MYNEYFDNPNRAVIFGAAGQDGSYLIEQLLALGWLVIGVSRRENDSRLEYLYNNKNFRLCNADVTDVMAVHNVIKSYHPTHIYNFAAQSSVIGSYSNVSQTINSMINGANNILSILCDRNYCENTKFFQASSSEIFGNSVNERGLQDELTKCDPVSPYGIAALSVRNLVNSYRNSYHVCANVGIMYNHSSERRGPSFVTRKISKFVARVFIERFNKNAIPIKLQLGDGRIAKDFGYAFDYLDAIKLIMSKDGCDDYIICTGENHTIEDICRIAFGYIEKDYKNYVQFNSNTFVNNSINAGDPSKLKSIGWRVTIPFESMVRRMVANDIWELSNGKVSS